jgi:hypothetical protein
MTPKPTDREKKICPAAAIHVFGSESASYFGFHMKANPASTD